MRWIAALSVAVALAFSMTIVDTAEAKKKPMNKMCTATQLDGKKASFKCAAAEKCCFDYVLNKGNCVAATAVCL